MKKSFLNLSGGFGTLLGSEDIPANDAPLSSPAEVLTVPYEVITEIASGKYVKAKFEKAFERIAYFIPVEKIEIRGGFNRTIIKKIEVLAGLILQHGLLEPLLVDILPDGRVIIEKGERRYRAIIFLITQGVDFPVIPCYVNGADVTEEKRNVDVWVSNMGRQDLHVLDQAKFVVRLKTMFGRQLSNKEIGKRLDLSRQSIDNLILIDNADDATKNELKNGTFGVTEAVRYIQKIRKEKKAAESPEQGSHQSSMYVSGTKDQLAKEIKDAEQFDGNVKDGDWDEQEDDSEQPPWTEGKKTKPSDKKKYDESRPEIKAIQNIIGLVDSIGQLIESSDIPDGAKKDIADKIGWIQNDSAVVRDYIHKNKKQ